MNIRELQGIIQTIAPVSIAEKWDNVGLICGDSSSEITGIAVCLDLWPQSIEEAIKNGCNVIISHHPLIFQGIRFVRTGDLTSDTLRLLIKHDINYIAAHTNLDFAFVSKALAEKCGATVVGNLSPVEAAGLMKFVVFVPTASASQVMDAVFTAGAGEIGNYSSCSFSMQGTGTFEGNDNTHPFIGKPGTTESVEEMRIEVVMPSHLKDSVVRAARKAHPYEEMAFDIYPLDNRDPRFGFGVIGVYDKPMKAESFVELVRECLGAKCVEVAGLKPDAKIRRVGFAGGSAFECYKPALHAGCDAFVTGEAKYHELFQPEHKGILTVIVGHGQSESPCVPYLAEMLKARTTGISIIVLQPKYPSQTR